MLTFVENIVYMETITTRDFRSNMAALFNKVDAGEQILVRRNNRMYTVIPVESYDLTMTSDMWKRIEAARKEIKEGNCITCRTEEELDTFLNSL